MLRGFDRGCAGRHPPKTLPNIMLARHANLAGMGSLSECRLLAGKPARKLRVIGCIIYHILDDARTWFGYMSIAEFFELTTQFWVQKIYYRGGFIAVEFLGFRIRCRWVCYPFESFFGPELHLRRYYDLVPWNRNANNKLWLTIFSVVRHDSIRNSSDK